MRLIDRYICREVVSHALLGLVVFTFVFFVPRLVQLMDLVVRHSGSPGAITLLFLCTLPPALAFTLPMAVLVGVLIGLGRMSADSEIVALHAAGVGLRRLLLPIGFVALVGTCITLATTFWLSPASLRTLRSLETSSWRRKRRFRSSHESSTSDFRTSYYTCKTWKPLQRDGGGSSWRRRVQSASGRPAARGPGRTKPR